MPDKDDLDLLLDSALSTYADPGPDSGLEQRVLSRISADHPMQVRVGAQSALAPRRRWLPWAIALPVAACLILFLVLAHQPANSPSRNAQEAHVSGLAPVSASPAKSPPPAAHNAAQNRRSAFRTSSPSAVLSANRLLPKREVFPSPQPLTPQEQAFAIFAFQGPEPDRKALAEAQQQIDAPLSIAAIHIPPIQSPDQGAN